jgi:hypothetical protein
MPPKFKLEQATMTRNMTTKLSSSSFVRTTAPQYLMLRVGHWQPEEVVTDSDHTR